ncbi:MAG: hypothetical protein MPJ25_00355 [Pirellulales bacterium]|nr:hypothetical protein [Pirellulales bacterium]
MGPPGQPLFPFLEFPGRLLGRLLVNMQPVAAAGAVMAVILDEPSAGVTPLGPPLVCGILPLAVSMNLIMQAEFLTPGLNRAIPPLGLYLGDGGQQAGGLGGLYGAG